MADVVTCKACGRVIDFRMLADCHPYGTPGCAFEERGGNGRINMPHREIHVNTVSTQEPTNG